MDIVISKKVSRPIIKPLTNGQVRLDSNSDLMVLISTLNDQYMYTYLKNDVAPELVHQTFELSDWDNILLDLPVVADNTSVLVVIN